MGLGKELLHMTPKALSIKRNIDRLDFIKIKRKTKTFILKSLCQEVEKGSHQLGENICKSRIHRRTHGQNIQRTT